MAAARIQNEQLNLFGRAPFAWMLDGAISLLKTNVFSRLQINFLM
jgi:hypothetical protein